MPREALSCLTLNQGQVVNVLIPSFETNRLVLKPITVEDVPAYEKNFVDYEVIRHLDAHVPWPYPAGGVKAFVQNQLLPDQGKTNWCWALFLKTDQREMIGSIEIRRSLTDNRGFWLARKQWGFGYMGEALEPVMTYAFRTLGFEKMIVTNAKGNDRSRRLKEKTGAQFLGVTPKKFVDPQYTESEIWEITKEDRLTRGYPKRAL